MRWNDGFCTKTDNSQQTSGMVANRHLLLDFYTRRIKEIEENGFDRHYEPPEELRINYESKLPNVCIRHNHNLTKSKWSVDDYRNKKYAKGFKTADIKDIPFWGELWE